MNKFIILAAVFAVVAGEAPPHVGLGGYRSGNNGNGHHRNGNGNGHHGNGNGGSGSGINEYVDEALLARVGELIAQGGDGSGTPQGNEGLQLDQEILTRVSGSLRDGASSGPGPVYGPPSQTGEVMLGEPEPAERIAEFDLTDDGASQDGGYSNGPSSGPSHAAPAPVYGAPAHRGPSSSGPISLGLPEVAERVADFSLSGQDAGSQGGNGGYN